MKKIIILIAAALISAMSLSCSNILDDTIFNKDKEDGRWDNTRFDKSKFSN